jgi:hypothetical protein
MPTVTDPYPPYFLSQPFRVANDYVKRLAAWLALRAD